MTTPTDQANGAAHSTLPPLSYSDPEVLEQEWKKIFDRGWHYIGTTAQVQNSGDRIIGKAGRISVVVTKDKEGELHALLNVCPHR